MRRVDVMPIIPATDVADARCLLPTTEIGICRGRLEFRMSLRPAQRLAVTHLPLFGCRRPFWHVMLLKQRPSHRTGGPVSGPDAAGVAVLAEARHQPS